MHFGLQEFTNLQAEHASTQMLTLASCLAAAVALAALPKNPENGTDATPAGGGGFMVGRGKRLVARGTMAPLMQAPRLLAAISRRRKPASPHLLPLQGRKGGGAVGRGMHQAEGASKGD